MRKLVCFLAVMLLFGCMSATKQTFNKYQFSGGEVTIGMNSNDVRLIAGAPTAIELPDAVKNAISPNGVYANMTRGQQYWKYGNLKTGDREEVFVTMTSGVVTNIDKYTKK